MYSVWCMHIQYVYRSVHLPFICACADSRYIVYHIRHWILQVPIDCTCCPVHPNKVINQSHNQSDPCNKNYISFSVSTNLESQKPSKRNTLMNKESFQEFRRVEMSAHWAIAPKCATATKFIWPTTTWSGFRNFEVLKLESPDPTWRFWRLWPQPQLQRRVLSMRDPRTDGGQFHYMPKVQENDFYQNLLLSWYCKSKSKQILPLFSLKELKACIYFCSIYIHLYIYIYIFINMLLSIYITRNISYIIICSIIVLFVCADISFHAALESRRHSEARLSV